MLMGLLLNVFFGFKEGDLVGYDMGYELKRMYIEKDEILFFILIVRDSFDKFFLIGYG